MRGGGKEGSSGSLISFEVLPLGSKKKIKQFTQSARSEKTSGGNNMGQRGGLKKEQKRRRIKKKTRLNKEGGVKVESDGGRPAEAVGKPVFHESKSQLQRQQTLQWQKQKMRGKNGGRAIAP